MPTPENDPGARIQRALNANGLQPPLKIDGQVGPATADGLDKVLAYLNGLVEFYRKTAADLRADFDGLRKANTTSADTIKRQVADLDRLRLDLDAALDQREAAEAEALDLRRQLQTGGRLPGLLADIDAALAKVRA